MRVEPFSVGSIVHTLKRGARGLTIVNDENDLWRFVRLLYYMNDEFSDEMWNTKTFQSGLFYRPVEWPNRKPIVDILCYTLMPNHFHLLLKEIQKGGVSLFMKKISESMSLHFNEKYDQKGSIFQGSYKGRNVNTDEYLRYVAAYIMVKNPFELYPEGGLSGAIKNFDKAYDWTIKYPFCSLADYSEKRESPIISKDVLGEMFDPKSFKEFARDVVVGGKWFDGVTFE